MVPSSSQLDIGSDPPLNNFEEVRVDVRKRRWASCAASGARGPRSFPGSAAAAGDLVPLLITLTPIASGAISWCTPPNSPQ